MKRKFSLFLNVAVLALCICAIAIGVYSAKNASLNVGGSVGFVAHNCEIELNGSIVACEDSNATATKEVTIPQTFIGRGEVPSAYSLDLNKTFSESESGKMYFSDMFEEGKVITITLKIKNQSKFDVVASALRPTFESSECTMSVTLDESEVAEVGTSIELTKEGASEAVMIITITLINDTDNISDIYISGTLFRFERKAQDTLIDFTIGDTSYQAEEGMTWGEWIESSYNTGYLLRDGIIVDSNNPTVYRRVYAGEKLVLQNDAIIANFNYAIRGNQL